MERNPLHTLEQILDRSSGESRIEALHVVIAYDDIPAYKRAIQLLVNIVRELRGNLDLRPIPWRFEVLESAIWRAHAARDVARAEIVIVTTSRAGATPETVRTWLASCCATKRTASTLVVALPAPQTAASPADDSAIEFMRTTAEQAGLAFLTPERVGGASAALAS